MFTYSFETLDWRHTNHHGRDLPLRFRIQIRVKPSHRVTNYKSNKIEYVVA